MNIKIVYDYNRNKLDFTDKNGIRFNLDLRGTITIIDGLSGSGKTMLTNSLKSMQKNRENLTGYDLSNIRFIDSQQQDIKDDNALYILDRADTFLNDDICARISSCENARFLIFARSAYNLFVSPNHFGEFRRNKNEISIVYSYSEPRW